MVMTRKKLIQLIDRERIKEAIERAEHRTSGEIRVIHLAGGGTAVGMTISSKCSIVCGLPSSRTTKSSAFKP